MAFNPFDIKPMPLNKCFADWNKLYPKAYDKNQADPYTKVRIILMNGTEFEAQWFLHQFARHCNNNDVRRELALIRRIEQQQQKRISMLKPLDESTLETTISYEQLAVDLTAIMAQNDPDPYVKATLDFALLEDFDHLYRYSDLLEMEEGIRGERLVGSYTEIMPGRPTISEHRYPFDDVRRFAPRGSSDMLTNLHAMIITAAEQQTMNYYMNIGQTHKTELGRRLYSEIAMIEEQHVTQYESLIDPNATWMENALCHEYTECYLYYSMMEDETDSHVRDIWEAHLQMEIAHLHAAAAMLKKYEKKDWQQVIPVGEFPMLLSFNSNVENNKKYVRDVLKNTVNNTSVLEEYAEVCSVPENYEFFKYNNTVNGSSNNVASHNVIEQYITEAGEDYRFEETAHPVKALRCRTCDNTDVGRNCD